MNNIWFARLGALLNWLQLASVRNIENKTFDQKEHPISPTMGFI